MSYKEMLAAVQLLTQVLAAVWLIYDATTGGFLGITVAQAAVKLLWVIGAVIGFSIFATIVATVLVSIARREEFKDEPADERDGLIGDATVDDLVTEIKLRRGKILGTNNPY